MTGTRRSVVVAGSAGRRRSRWRAGLVVLLALVAVIGAAAVVAANRPQVPVAAAPSRKPMVLHRPTRDSAVTAAVDALYALTVPAITDQARFAAAVKRLAAPGAGEHVRDVFGDTDPDLIAAFRRGPSVLRGAPLGYRIDRYTTAAASVAIWSVAIAGAYGERAQSQWRTLVVDLKWTPRGWRVTNGGGVDGPTPSTPQAELAAEAAGFRSFRYVP
jgi:hypothetical protein